MPNIGDLRDGSVSDMPRRFYLKMMATWALDLMQSPASMTWADQDPLADFKDRNWKRLYAGSILDD